MCIRDRFWRPSPRPVAQKAGSIGDLDGGAPSRCFAPQPARATPSTSALRALNDVSAPQTARPRVVVARWWSQAVSPEMRTTTIFTASTARQTAPWLEGPTAMTVSYTHLLVARGGVGQIAGVGAELAVVDRRDGSDAQEQAHASEQAVA